MNTCSLKEINTDTWVMTNKAPTKLYIYSRNRKGKWVIRETISNNNGFNGNNIVDIFSFYKEKYNGIIKVVNAYTLNVVYSTGLDSLRMYFEDGVSYMNKVHLINDFEVMSVKMPDKTISEYTLKYKKQTLRDILMDYGIKNDAHIVTAKLMPVNIEDDIDSKLRWLKIKFSNDAVIQVAFYNIHHI